MVLLLPLIVPYGDLSGKSRRPPLEGDSRRRERLSPRWSLRRLLGLTASGAASDRDETTITAQVTSAEHETQEGDFSLGPDATVVAKPGSELRAPPARQNGKKVRITLTTPATWSCRNWNG